MMWVVGKEMWLRVLHRVWKRLEVWSPFVKSSLELHFKQELPNILIILSMQCCDVIVCYSK